MPSAAQRTIYTPWTPGLQSSWTVTSVRNALTSHENGDFSTSAQLIDAMGRDDRLCAVEETRLKGLFGSTFTVDPVDGDESDNAAMAMAEELDANWLDMFPEADLMELWHWRLFAGVSFGELAWKRSAQRWEPRLKVWNPQWVYADEDRSVYLLQTREGQVEIPFGGADGKWLVLGRGRRPWMNGLVRSLATPWLVAQFCLRDWARYSERHGLPIVLADVPAVSDDVDKETFFEDVRALSTETTVQLPTGLDERGTKFDLRLLEATADTWEGFQGLLKHVHDTYAIALTGNNLTTLIEGGAYAASIEASERLRIYSKADSEELSTQLRWQAIQPWAAFNFKGGIERIPWPRWDTEPPEDINQRVATIKMAGEALTALAEAGWQPDDIEKFGEQFNVALKPIDAPPVAEEPPQPAPKNEEQDDGTQDEQQMTRRVRRRASTAVLIEEP